MSRKRFFHPLIMWKRNQKKVRFFCQGRVGSPVKTQIVRQTFSFYAWSQSRVHCSRMLPSIAKKTNLHWLMNGELSYSSGIDILETSGACSTLDDFYCCWCYCKKGERRSIPHLPLFVFILNGNRDRMIIKASFPWKEKCHFFEFLFIFFLATKRIILTYPPLGCY